MELFEEEKEDVKTIGFDLTKSSINKKTTACCHYAYGTLPGRNAPLSTTCLPLICAKITEIGLKSLIALLKTPQNRAFSHFTKDHTGH